MPSLQQLLRANLLNIIMTPNYSPGAVAASATATPPDVRRGLPRRKSTHKFGLRP